MFIAALIGGALAAAIPGPLLGPDGPMWIGPLPPGSPGQEVVVVDPRSGALFVEDGEDLRWSEGAWSVDGAPVLTSCTAQPAWRCDLQDGVLLGLDGVDGRRRRYRYDPEGRLIGIRWADGAGVDVHYDDSGRVEAIEGPGPRRMSLRWTGGLEVRDILGRITRVEPISEGDEGSRGVAVTDALGRTARLWYAEDADGHEHISAWQDPRGGFTRARWRAGAIELQDPVGRLWRVALDHDGRVVAVTTPGGHLWRWTRDDGGRVVGLLDPSGRSARWERDPQGRVVASVLADRRWEWRRDRLGAVTGIVTPGGGEIRLERDAGGRVVRLVDPAGDELRVQRQASGRVTSVVGRAGGRWTLSYDLRGRVNQVVDSAGHVVELARDSVGRLIGIRDHRYGSTTLQRSVGGLLTRVLDASGRSTGFVRDAIGRLVAVRRSDGSTLRLQRDAAGDVVGIQTGDQVVRIERDGLGQPSRAGEVRWTRDGAGWVQRVTAPGLNLTLLRDGAGRIREARAAGWRVTIQRDRAGDPVRWEGTDGALAVRRDPGGAVVEELGRIELTRDVRGLVAKAQDTQGHTWTWQRDAAGRVLRMTGPGGLQAGLDRDAAGRVVLVRYPGGALLRRDLQGDVVRELLEDGGGRRERTVALGPSGRIRWQQGEARETWRYDSLGKLVAVEQGEGSAWSWTPGVVHGPHGEFSLLDERGWTTEASVPAGPPAWGIASHLLTLLRDERGRLERVAGELGSWTVQHDALGRLTRLGGSGGDWRVRYDPVGRPSAVIAPDGTVDELLWGPGSVGTPRGLGGGQAWGRLTADPANLLAWGAERWVGTLGWERDGAGASVVTPAGLGTRWVITEDGEITDVHATPTGFWDGDAVAHLGAQGALQLFPGGPLLIGGTALDPVSGRRTDGRGGWPWSPEPLTGPLALSQLDPLSWAPDSPWAHPMDILQRLGALPRIDPGSWTDRRGSADLALPQLPAGLQQVAPPMGPWPGDWPMSEDPVTTELVGSVMPGASPLDPGAILRCLLVGDSPAKELPPGLWVPGLEVMDGDRSISPEGRP